MKRLIFERLTNPVDPLPVVKSDTDRVREVLRRQGHFDRQIETMIQSWIVIESARRQLGLK